GGLPASGPTAPDAYIHRRASRGRRVCHPSQATLVRPEADRPRHTRPREHRTEEFTCPQPSGYSPPHPACALATEATIALGVVTQCAQEVDVPEVRPVCLAE